MRSFVIRPHRKLVEDRRSLLVARAPLVHGVHLVVRQQNAGVLGASKTKWNMQARCNQKHGQKRPDAVRSSQKHTEAIRSNEKQTIHIKAEAVSRVQKRSEAVRSGQKRSEAIRSI